jgi:hypothetical protein
LFKPGANYLEVLSAYCKPELKKSLGSDFFEEGANADEKNFKNWNLELNGLQLNFDPYQVGPYAVGPQKVLIPFIELRPIALPGGFLDRASQ